ncbi:MAG TPA: hypothetical protein VHF47_05540 [Acidimicrobiales bacterium]|nr:hypothetical protein [Acidimicrobiales bacterium]
MARWDPWAALTERDYIVYDRMPVPASAGGAMYWPVDEYALIMIDPSEGRVRRRCLLAHELVHDERWGGCDASYMPPSWKAVVRREEGWVNDIVADRLVPPCELRAFCDRAVERGEAVTAAEVAAEFDVTDEVAERALRRLVGAGG